VNTHVYWIFCPERAQCSKGETLVVLHIFGIEDEYVLTWKEQLNRAAETLNRPLNRTLNPYLYSDTLKRTTCSIVGPLLNEVRRLSVSD